MADSSFICSRQHNYQHDGVLIAGSFSATGAGITAGTVFGEGYTVAYNAAGNYTVTTRLPYRHVVAFGANLGLTTPNADFVINCGLPGGGAGAVVTLNMQCFPTATGVAADPAAAADRISFWMLLSNSGADAVR